MLSYFPAYQFPKVFKKMKQNNDFQLDIISIHNTSYVCLHQNMHFFPQAWLLKWRLLNFNQKVFQTVKSKEYPCDKNKKVTKTNGYFSTDVRLGGEVSLNDIIIPKTHHCALGFYMTYISKSIISLEIKIFSNIYWHIGGSNCFLTRSLQESNGLILMIFSAFFEDKPGTDASS